MRKLIFTFKIVVLIVLGFGFGNNVLFAQNNFLNFATGQKSEVDASQVQSSRMVIENGGKGLSVEYTYIGAWITETKY